MSLFFDNYVPQGAKSSFSADENVYNTMGEAGQAGTIDSRKRQSELAQALQMQASGQAGPSQASLQMQRGMEQNAAMAAGNIASQRGVNPALAARMTNQALLGANQQQASQAAQMRLQEQQQAQSALAQQLAQMRGADIGQWSTSGNLRQGAQEMNRQVAAQNADLEMQKQELEAKIRATSNAADEKMAGSVFDTLAKGATLGMAHGGTVDSESNDVVPAMLSPGEIVLPRSVAQSDEAPEDAAAFVAALKRRKEPQGYGAVLEHQRAMHARLARLESMLGGGQ